MLRIGLTGGIGAGKSTVAATFAECGGVIVDGDVIAREVVEPGTEGLAALVDAFGEDILLPSGELNRPALAAKAFADEEQRKTLNGIVHPLVARRRQQIIASVPEDKVVVEDIPLLVESNMAPLFPLVVIVHADPEVRVKRLIKRGMDESDAHARIAAQATEEQRRAVADVWLDNSGAEAELVEQARELWQRRVLPLAENIRMRRTVSAPTQLVPYDTSWPDQARRIVARIQTACGSRALRVDHIGSTAVRGLDAKDVIDVQVTVESLDVADELSDTLADIGYPRVEGITSDVPQTDDPSLWRKRIHASADPGRPANVHLRVDGWPNQQFALLFRDWLEANPDVREEYLAVKRYAQSAPDYVAAKEPWLRDAYRRARSWADATGWQP
ncbi:dephospho-CoA kinase [Mycobacterium sp.]|jgi:dephospho-CoA kinase|uniref:dephospho-CoA kinase n=1 Tax=Mycobacterium sp. TaxID=1785 RepID=UPI002D31C05F|nr:dephospho-CoA kinase [Mycobacterium sp.]HZA09854.1 dephospho-CoA kinase [Mycobacterium sp.]